MSRILLLGATGLIGRAVVARFIQSGHEVTAILRRPDRAPSGLHRIVQGDLAEPEAWLDLLDQCDGLIHCACDWSGDMAVSEPRLIRGIVDRGFASRIVYTGGVWCFGNRDGLITEETPIDLPEGFDWSVAGWQALLAGGMNAVWVHPGLVWSLEEPHYAPIGEALQARGPVPVLTPGHQLQPLVFTTDLADGYLRAFERGAPGRDYLFVGQNLAMEAVAAAWAETRGLPLSRQESAPRDPYSWSQNVSSARALAELGWRPQYTDAVKTLRNSGR
ncbi:MAG: NAD-dependent epimerase/dehydratase family protein [Pseudomonadota bacterium]